MLQSLSNTVKGLQSVMFATLLKRDPRTGVSEKAISRCSSKQVLLNNSQNSQESTYVGVSFYIKFRSGHSQMFFKKKFFKKLENFYREACVSESFLIKLQAPTTAALLKKDSNTAFFSLKFAKLLRIPCFTNISSSESFRYPACNFIKKDPPVKMFFCEFCKNFQNIFSFDRTPDGCFLCLSVNFEKFFRTLLL